MTIQKILIVDDEMLVRNFLAETLRRKKFEVETAESGQKALNLLKDTPFDMIITDMKMPGMTGIDVLRKAKELSPHTIVVIITAFGSIENAVEAMRLGAFNYLIKPFSPDTIEAVIEKAQEHQALIEENQYLRQQLSQGGSGSAPNIIAESPSMKKILNDIMQVAQSNTSVFIHGESGTGKEVIAHAIHTHSQRAQQPFIKVNCAAIPETLIESEFFGHEKGSFTGATSRRLGRFELAHKGTLLLDEITETPMGLQAKLLRVIQEQEFERVGGTKPIKVDVRLISTSNRHMKEALAQKMIREDLYYRLDVFPVYLPPLRDRKEDIVPLAHYFLKKVAAENHRECKILTDSSVNKLLSYSWPGNIRELANVIERAVVMDAHREVSPDHLLIENMSSMASKSTQDDSPLEMTGAALQKTMTLKELEKKMIVETLRAQNNNKAKTAEALGINVSTLRKKILSLEIPIS